MALYVRQLTEAEERQIQQLATSKTQQARLVQRAKVIWLSHQRVKPPQIATKVGLCTASVRIWIRRFNLKGTKGLNDNKRTGRPIVHTEEIRGKVIALARTKPKELGYPFVLWTIRRLQTALCEREGINLSISVIWRWIKAEGLVWKKQQTWFSIPVDDQFVEKRGPSFMPIPIPYQSVG